MLKRFGFRVVLPCLNLGSLILFFACSKAPAVSVGDWNWTVENPYYPLLSGPRLLAIAINAPASLVSTVILESAGISNLKFASWLVPIMCPFIIVVWYFTGRWIDGQLKWLPQDSLGRKRRATFYIGVVVVGLLAIYSARWTIYFLGGGIAGWHGETPFNAAMTYGLTGWLLLLELMLITTVMHRRGGTNLAGSASH